MRARSKLAPEIGEQQCGFKKDTGTRNAIFMMRRLCERAIEMQQDIYLCFIDYTKAFDRVKHEVLLDMLQSLDLDGKDMRLIRNLYWEQSACIRIEGETSQYTDIKRGVRQGCVFSPDLFNLYSEVILRELGRQEGVIVGGQCINNIRYADDTTLIAKSQEELQALLNKVVTASNLKGLTLNHKKTKCMVISKEQIGKVCSINIDNNQIEQVDKFNYLGSILTSDGRCDEDIKRRISLAKDAFGKLSCIITNRSLTIDLRKRVINSYVIPILTYGSECWVISEAMKKKIDAVEMWFIRRLLKISWTERKTNEEVLRMTKSKKTC